MPTSDGPLIQRSAAVRELSTILANREAFLIIDSGDGTLGRAACMAPGTVAFVDVGAPLIALLPGPVALPACALGAAAVFVVPKSRDARRVLAGALRLTSKQLEAQDLIVPQTGVGILWPVLFVDALAAFDPAAAAQIRADDVSHRARGGTS